MEAVRNQVELRFDARSVNEGFARMAVMAFMMDMNPTLDEMEDVKTAVSEAVTNAIIHGYQEEKAQVKMTCLREGVRLTVIIEDEGVGIEDVTLARNPFYTTKPDEERSGMGFSFMEAFMDELSVTSTPGKGTKVVMTKYIAREDGI